MFNVASEFHRSDAQWTAGLELLKWQQQSFALWNTLNWFSGSAEPDRRYQRGKALQCFALCFPSVLCTAWPDASPRDPLTLHPSYGMYGPQWNTCLIPNMVLLHRHHQHQGLVLEVLQTRMDRALYRPPCSCKRQATPPSSSSYRPAGSCMFLHIECLALRSTIAIARPGSQRIQTSHSFC